MENEKSEVAYDSHEQDLQRIDEIQTLSEQVLALVQGDDGSPKRTALTELPAQAHASSAQAALELNVKPPMRTESSPAQASASFVHTSSDSDALRRQAAQELSVQPLKRTESAPAQLLNNHSRPGAYYSAPGTPKRTALTALPAQAHASSAQAVLNVQPPMRTESAPAQASASLMRASSGSYALKRQAAQEPNVQPLMMRAESAPAQLINNHSRPGAYYSAPGTTQLVAAQLSSSSRAVAMAEDSSRFMQEDSGEYTEFDLEQPEGMLVCVLL